MFFRNLSFLMKRFILKNEEDQTKELIKTLSMLKCKRLSTNEKSFNEWFRFKESEEYKEWIKDAKAYPFKMIS